MSTDKTNSHVVGGEKVLVTTTSTYCGNFDGEELSPEQLQLTDELFSCMADALVVGSESAIAMAMNLRKQLKSAGILLEDMSGLPETGYRVIVIMSDQGSDNVAGFEHILKDGSSAPVAPRQLMLLPLFCWYHVLSLSMEVNRTTTKFKKYNAREVFPPRWKKFKKTPKNNTKTPAKKKDDDPPAKKKDNDPPDGSQWITNGDRQDAWIRRFNEMCKQIRIWMKDWQEMLALEVLLLICELGHCTKGEVELFCFCVCCKSCFHVLLHGRDFA